MKNSWTKTTLTLNMKTSNNYKENARKKAEKRFKEALKQAGLTENDIDVDVKMYVLKKGRSNSQ